ncbi:hypothetical protein [Leeia oryzae]|uniref:hypothetical protein n=1 Tax=Leeia oryzae TaxID=356662 RepID=UPI00035C8A79|nr:hypothetical protein [Leeia oryzae]
MSDSADPLISVELASFLEREVAIDAASRGADLCPSSARSMVAVVDADYRHVTVWIDREKSRPFVTDVLASGEIAVVFCLPESERSVQLKGRRVEQVETTQADIVRAERAAARFVDGVAKLGHGRQFAEAYMAFQPQHLVGIRFEVTAIFEQTPGPNAGKKY